MLDTIFAKLGAILLAPIMAISGFFAPEPVAPPAVGTSLPEAVAVFETSLAAPITANATTMTLTANSIRGGGSLSGFNCFTIDEGSAQAEFICGDVATTTVTNLLRGISPADGITEDTDLQFSHRRGANVKITDFPIIQRLKLQNNGEGTFENLLSYASGVTPTGSNHLVDKEYVDATITGTSSISYDRQIVAGTAGETISSGQIVYFDGNTDKWMLADASISASSTNVQLGIAQGAGTNGVIISGGVLRSGYDETQGGMTAGNTIYLSNTAGATSTSPGTNSVILGQARSAGVLYFDPIYGNSVAAGSNTTFSGTNTFSATTTLASTTINGLATFNGGITGHASTTFTVYTASTTWSKPDGLEYIEVWVCGGGGGGDTTSSGGGGGGAGGCAYELLTAAELSSTSTVTITIGVGGAAETAGNSTSFSSFLSADGGGGATGQSGASGGVGSGGDLNLTGGGGGAGGEPTGLAFGGTGGSNVFASGGLGPATSGSGDIGGGAGSTCGGGGGGGASGSSSAGGGTGGVGCVTIKEHF